MALLAITKTAFLCGLYGAAGVAVVIFISMGVARLVDYIKEVIEVNKNKAKMVLKNKKDYIRNEYYEELMYIEKYEEQLKKNEWPAEMEEKFELVEFETAAGTDEEGSLYTYKKQLLRLKDKFRPKKAEKKDDESKNQDEKK